MSNTIQDLNQNAWITVVQIKNAEHLRDIEKDSPVAYWICSITFCSSNTIIPKRYEGIMIVESFSKSEIRGGRYNIEIKKFDHGIPLFKAAS